MTGSGHEYQERERERELGTEFYSKNPTPNGSRPSGLIGLGRMSTQETPPQHPEHTRKGRGDKRETDLSESVNWLGGL